MELSPTAHDDTFARDNLPPLDLWPELLFDLPELHYPDRLNCGTALLDEVITEHGADRAACCPRREPWTYGELLAHGQPDRPRPRRGPRGGARQPGAAARAEQPVAGGLLVRRAQGRRCRRHHDAAAARRRDRADRRDGRRSSWRCATRGSPMTSARPASTAADRHLRRAAATSHDIGRRQGRHVRRRRDRCGRRRAAGVHVGHDRASPRRRCTSTATCSRSPTRSQQHVLKPTPDDVFTGTPPLAFTFGLGGLVVFPLRAGASTLLIEKATPDELADHDRGAPASRSASRRPPPIARCCRAARLDRVGTLRRCCLGGRAPAPRRPGEAFHEATGVRIIDGIGATEMLHIFISAADDDIRPGSTGRPVPGYRRSGARRGRAARCPPASRAARGEGPDRLPLPRRRAADATTCRAAGTSPATPTSATLTATSGTRRAATT